MAGLWSEVLAERCGHSRRKGPSQCTDNVRLARRVVEEGQYRKAIQLLTSGGLAPASEEVCNEMLQKYPQAPPPKLPTSPVPPPATCTIHHDVVVKALRSFSPGPQALQV